LMSDYFCIIRLLFIALLYINTVIVLMYQLPLLYPEQVS
jgi:hypothetical protein